MSWENPIKLYLFIQVWVRSRPEHLLSWRPPVSGIYEYLILCFVWFRWSMPLKQSSWVPPQLGSRHLRGWDDVFMVFVSCNCFLRGDPGCWKKNHLSTNGTNLNRYVAATTLGFDGKSSLFLIFSFPREDCGDWLSHCLRLLWSHCRQQNSHWQVSLCHLNQSHSWLELYFV